MANQNSTLLKGDFEKIFDQTHGKIYNFLLKLTRNEALAEDLTQNSYLKLWENLDHINLEDNLLPLLYTYAKNLYLSDLRRQKVSNGYLMTIVNKEEPSESLEDKYIFSEYLKVVHSALRKMPSRRREVYQLCREEGLSHKEISEKMSISISTIEAQMNSALKLIKRELRGQCNLDLKSVTVLILLQFLQM